MDGVTRNSLRARIGRGFAVRLFPVAFIAVALGLTASAWLRPPLSRDVSGFRITVSADMTGPDRVAILLTALLGVGAVVVLLRPARLGVVAGLVFVGGLASTAAVVLNHASLIESFDREQEQRELIARVIAASPDRGSLTQLGNGRAAALPDSGEPSGLTRGLVYLHRGTWVVAWAALGVFFASAGTLVRRLGATFAWLLAGIGVSALVCAPRLHAEYHLQRALQAEAEGNLRAAEYALNRAVAASPELELLERTWFLTGKLDYLTGQDTSQARYFRAAQLARREQWLEAVAVIEELSKSREGKHPVVKAQAARVWAAVGLDHYVKGPAYTDAGTSYTRQDRNLTAAITAWERGLNADPRNHGCAVAIGLAQARLMPNRPDLVEVWLVPEINAIADQVIRADLLATVGDTRFRAGDVATARRRYAESFAAFNLPTVINYRAQQGLGGW